MSSISNYVLKNFYKGKFLKYCNDNFYEDNDYKAYIEIKDLILSNSSSVILTESINSSNIVNNNDLNIEKNIKSINSIKCKPLFVNKFLPLLKENDTVFIFLINNDPKKIFYVPITNDISDMNDFHIKIGNNAITVNKDEIILEKQVNEDDDISITISDKGIEFVGEIFANGQNITKFLNPNIK